MAAVAAEVARLVKESPPKNVQVNRVEPNGQQHAQTTSLPQLMAEMNDLMKVSVIQQRQVLDSNKEVSEDLKRYTAALRKVLRDAL